MSTTKQSQDLVGKVALVTGATSGLGLRIFRELARRGAKVYASGRNEELGREIAAEFPNASFVKIDLSTVARARQGEAFLEAEGEHGRLDILVNNAAALGKVYELSPDGIVDSMSTTFIGHFVLVRFLLPLMKKTSSLPNSDVRIVTVSSETYKFPSKETFAGVARGDFSNKYGGDSFIINMKRYSLSKTAQMVWMRELAVRFKAEGIPIKLVSADPAGVYSEGLRSGVKKQFGRFAGLVDWLFSMVAASPEVASASTIWAVTSPDAKTDSWVTRRGSRTVGGKWTALANDEAIRVELWASAEKFVNEKLAQMQKP